MKLYSTESNKEERYNQDNNFTYTHVMCIFYSLMYFLYVYSLLLLVYYLRYIFTLVLIQ